jgi:hypothetical protein
MTLLIESPEIRTAIRPVLRGNVVRWIILPRARSYALFMNGATIG